MNTALKTRPIGIEFTRTAALICIVAVLVGSVTFAALRTQNNYLNGSTLTTATVDLQMSKQQFGSYGTTLDGFDFNSVSPNGPAMPAIGHDLFLKNLGSTDLDTQISLDSSHLSNVYRLNLQQIFLVLTDVSNSAQPVKYSLADLDNAYQNATPLSLHSILASAATDHISLQMQLGDIAISPTDQVALYGLNFVFSGVSG